MYHFFKDKSMIVHSDWLFFENILEDENDYEYNFEIKKMQWLYKSLKKFSLCKYLDKKLKI